MNDRDFSDALVWIANSPILAIDCETQGLHPHEWDKVLGISAANETKAIYFSLRHPGSENLSYDQARNLLELLSQPRHRVLFHNALFDWACLRYEGWTYPTPWSTTWDTMVAAWLLDENEPKKLEEQIVIHKVASPQEAKEQKQRKARLTKIGWANSTYDDIQQYGTFDARYTFDLYQVQQARIAQDESLAVALIREHHFLQVCDEMISTGVLVNAEEAQRKLAECDLEIEKIEIEYPGLNFDSPKQLAELLYSDDGWCMTPIAWTPGGQPSTDKDTLLRFLEYEPRINDIFNYRKLRKARSTYYFPLCERVGRDGRVHAWYRPHGTKPGRMSCLVGDSLIRTSLGGKQMRDVRPGDLVYTHQNRWRPVLRQWCVGVEEVFDVLLSNGETVTCTASHRFLTLDGWKSIEEMSVERREEVGLQAGESVSCLRGLPVRGSVDHGGSRASWNDDAQRDAHHPRGGFGSGAQGTRISNEINHETRLEKSDVWEGWQEAPQLQGRVRRWAWVSNRQGRWEARVRTSLGHGEGARGEETPAETRRASHRQRPPKQQSRQLGAGDSRRSHDYPLLASEGQCVCRIEAIYARGSAEVYDLTVEEDESYFSGGVFSHNCSDPNLQTLPHESTLPGIKSCFVAQEGYSLMEYDLSQAELRVAAYYADDSVLHEHLDSGDVHSGTAKAMFGDASEVHRGVAKNLNFGALYGIGAKKFVKTARRKGDRTITEDLARSHLAAWRNLYAGVTQAMKDAQKIAEERGYVKLWPVGRVRRFGTHHAHLANSHPKDAFNSIVQGGVGEYMKDLMMALREPARQHGVRMVLNVHDSLVFEVPDQMDESWSRLVQDEAARLNPFHIEMPVGVKTW